MSPRSAALAVLGLIAGLAQAQGVRLEGRAVNGSRDGAPLAGAEVVLRTGRDGPLEVAATTMTDGNGRFVFDQISAAPGMIVLPGVNHHGVHYPGVRMRLTEKSPLPPVTLTALDAVASPNPLVVEIHEIDIRVEKGVLEVMQTLRIDNPSATTYVGANRDEASPTTLALSIPGGFERVTFQDEFNGRRFKLRDGQLVTDIPWTPGTREVKLTYLLPMNDSKGSLRWSVDAPCKRYRLSIHGANLERFQCNLPRAAGATQQTVIFESSDPLIASGHVVDLGLNPVPASWTLDLRWTALLLLAGLIAVTAGLRLMRRASSAPAAATLPERKAA